MFAQGRAYEPFMGRWSRRVAPLLVAFAEVSDGEAILDVGAGTGAIASAVVAVAPSARLTGVDPAAAYVAVAQAAVTSDRVRFVVGDAQHLEFPDHTFDRCLSLFVMNFMPDPAKALREQIRVTRPGGTIAAAVWDYSDGMRMLRVFWDEAIAGNPSIAARDEGHMPLCKHGELGALWRTGGLMEIEEQPLTIAQSFPSFDDYWGPFLGGQGPAGAYVAAMTENDREALRRRVRRRLLHDGPDRPIALEARAWAVRGRVP